MTDSNFKIDKDNILFKQIDADNLLSDIKFDKLEPLSKFNIQTEGFLNFNANLNTENIINEFFIKDDELDAYIDDTIDPTKETFNAFSVDKSIATEEKITDLKPVLNFLSLHNFIKEKDFKRPSDMRLINNLLLEHTGYNWNQFNNNLITRDVIESNEFQEGLLKIRTHYENDGFVIEDLEASNESELLKLTKGLGVEIGAGLAADLVLAPFLAAGPKGWVVYGVAQFVIGVNANIEAQRIRLGPEAIVGNDWINWNEAIAAGFVQMIPGGVTAKGWKGIRNSAVWSSSLAVTETGIRDLLGDDVSRDEYLLSIGVGGVLGAGFKGTFEGLDAIFRKFKGNNNVDLNKLLTKEDKDLLIKSNNELKEINTKQIEAEGGDVKKLENDFKTQIEQQQQQQQQPQGNTKKNENLGDSDKTPNQFSDRGMKSENLELIEELIRLKKLKNEQGTSPVKTKYAMQLAGLKLFDDQVIDLSKTTRIKEYAQIYATINDIVPSEDLTVALTQVLVLATDEVVNANTRFINALNSKDIARIEKAIDDLNKAFDEVNDWLGLSLPSATTFGRTGQALQIQGESGVAGKSVEEVMRMSQVEKRIATETASARAKGLDERIEETGSLKEELQKVLEETKQTNDFSELYRISNKIEQTNGDVEKIVAIEKYQILPSLLNKFAKVFNEIGINALLAAPTTQEVNLLGGILNTYLNSFKFALGARNKTEIEAALRHFIALHSNFNFARKAWKRSWDMEDNFVNLGNSKFESSQDRYQIATTNTDWVSRIGINWTGKGIRLPSRLMTSNDALIQASNLIGYANMKFFLHGKNKLKLKGDKLNEYVNNGINTILEYYLSNGKKQIPSDGENKIISRILKESQEFSKSITFTNDIRTESIFGKVGKEVDKFAQNPLARIYFTFVKVPINLIAEGFRLHPITGIPITIGKNNKFFVGNSKGQNLNLVNEALSEVRHDLLSRDPLVVQRARGGLNLAQGLLLTVAGMSVYYGNKFLEEDYVPPMILTGGGPDYTTPEGKAMWKAMWKNGWRPYSIGKLQYDEDGNPKFINGEPVYKFSSYQNIGIDPLSQVIGMTVDFVNSQGYINGKPYEDFTVGLVGVFSRNIFNASYTSQIDEFFKLLGTFPGLVDETGENPLKDYKVDKAKEYLAKQFTSRIVPYSNLLARFKQIPGDILELIHGREEVASDKDMSRFIQQRDTKVRPGDVIDQNLEIEDENFNEKEIWKELQTYLNNNLQSKVPGYSADLPFLREHITNDPVLVPNKEGPFFFKTDLFSLQKHSTNKNYPIYQTLKLIGRQLPEPKDVIYGRYSKDEIEPKKLNTREYALLREFVNTHIPKTEKYGKVNLLQAINKYLDTKEFKILKEIIEEHGLSSDKGQIAAKEIYSNLYSINNYYIKSGEYEFFEQKLGTEEIKKRVEKKGKIMEEFINEIQQELSNY